MNNYRSLSLAFRVGLAFHGLNMEGTSGNVVEPRRIALGDAEYDGISGEMVRRHVLENFRDLADGQLPMHQNCQGLDPARGRQDLEKYIAAKNVEWTRKEGNQTITQVEKVFSPSTEALVKECAVCDVGGYLIPERNLKRDSTFEVGWLISEPPSQADYTQHAAYHPDQQHNLFTFGIRSAIYGGVMRFDLDRIGHNDWWWLQEDGKAERWPVDEKGRKSRARALLTAVKQWLLSPSGARQAGWLQHQGEPFEGVLVLSKGGPAPFISPIALEVADGRPRVKANPSYREVMKRLVEKNAAGLKSYEFQGQAELSERFDALFQELGLA